MQKTFLFAGNRLDSHEDRDCVFNHDRDLQDYELREDFVINAKTEVVKKLTT